MKRIAYPNFGKGRSYVDYQIFDGQRCIFSGVTDGGTSTINAAERIIKAIAEAEKVPLEFYDLQTQKGYSYYRPGEYSLDLLILKDGRLDSVIAWRPENLPPEVLKAFKNHIGRNPRLRT